MANIIYKRKQTIVGGSGASTTGKEASVLWLHSDNYNASTGVWTDVSPCNWTVTKSGSNPTKTGQWINITANGQGFTISNFPFIPALFSSKLIFTILCSVKVVTLARTDFLGNRGVSPDGGLFFLYTTTTVGTPIAIATIGSGSVTISNTLIVGQTLNIAASYDGNTKQLTAYFNGTTSSAIYSSFNATFVQDFFVGFPSAFNSSPNPIDIKFVAAFPRVLTTTELNNIFLSI